MHIDSWLRRVAAVSLAAIAIVLLVGQGVDEEENARDIAEDIFDAFLDSGIVARDVRYDDPLLAQRVIVVSGDVNARLAQEVVSKLLYLDLQDPARPIDLYLRTEGGWYGDTFAICDAIRRVRAPVNTWALGDCLSAGACILAAGTGKRRAFGHSKVMLHVTTQNGNEPMSEERIERERHEAFWKERAKLPAAWFPMDGDKSYYLSAEKALEFGIIDEIHTR